MCVRVCVCVCVCASSLSLSAVAFLSARLLVGLAKRFFIIVCIPFPFAVSCGP